MSDIGEQLRELADLVDADPACLGVGIIIVGSIICNIGVAGSGLHDNDVAIALAHSLCNALHGYDQAERLKSLN